MKICSFDGVKTKIVYETVQEWDGQKYVTLNGFSLTAEPDVDPYEILVSLLKNEAFLDDFNETLDTSLSPDGEMIPRDEMTVDVSFDHDCEFGTSFMSIHVALKSGGTFDMELNLDWFDLQPGMDKGIRKPQSGTLDFSRIVNQEGYYWGRC